MQLAKQLKYLDLLRLKKKQKVREGTVCWVDGRKVVRIPLTQGKSTIVDVRDYKYLKERNWAYNKGEKHGYAFTSLGGKYIQLGRVILGIDDNRLCADHISGDKLDNRRCNLRICDRRQNMMNRKKGIKSYSSKFKGVCWCKESKKWSSGIKFENKRFHLGSYSSEKDAALAYNKAAKKYFGEFARINNI